MNERQARKEGLQFTGKCDRMWRNEEVKAEAAHIRKLGFRAVVVQEDSMASVYASSEYFQALSIYEKWKQAVRGVSSTEAKIVRLEEELKSAQKLLAEQKELAAQPEPLKVERW